MRIKDGVYADEVVSRAYSAKSVKNFTTTPCKTSTLTKRGDVKLILDLLCRAQH